MLLPDPLLLYPLSVLLPAASVMLVPLADIPQRRKGEDMDADKTRGTAVEFRRRNKYSRQTERQTDKLQEESSQVLLLHAD